MEFSEARTARPLHLVVGGGGGTQRHAQTLNKTVLWDGIMRTQVMTSFTFTPNVLNLDQDGVKECVGIARI